MTCRLYYSEPSAAMEVCAILEEIGAPYELVWTNISSPTWRDPALLAANPNGWIPVLAWENSSIYECGAITVLLCDRHPEAALAPAASDPDRGLFLQWLFYFSSSIQVAYQMSYHTKRFCAATKDEDSVRQRSARRLEEVWQVVDDAIGENSWLLGERFSAIDIYLYMLTTWLSPKYGHPVIDRFANVQRVAASAATRPAVRGVFQPD